MQSNQQQPPLSEADIPQLLQLLQSALNLDPAVQKQAEALLASLGTRVGFCSCLAVSTQLNCGRYATASHDNPKQQLTAKAAAFSGSCGQSRSRSQRSMARCRSTKEQRQ